MPDNWIDDLTSIGIRIGLAAIALLVGVAIAAMVRALVARLMQRPNVARRIGPSMRQIIVRLVYSILLAVTVVVVLLVLGIPERVVFVGLAITIIILGLALQQSLANFAATVVFLIFEPFKLGDDIETMGFRGIVEDIHLFNTVIKLFDNRVASLPNAKIQEAGVVNYSKTGTLWATVTLTVGYDQDLARVRDLITEIVEADPRVLEEPPNEVVVVELAPQGVRIEIHPTVQYNDWWPVLTDLQEKVIARFNAEGIPLAVAPETQVRILEHPGPEDEQDVE
jgi:small conductance mechanosensitive channel